MTEGLLKLRLGAVAQRLDGILSEETDEKQKKRVAMGIQIAHIPA